MEGTVRAHIAEYGHTPDLVIEVPQVTTLFGAFAEFCSGWALSGTTSQGMRIAFSKRVDGQVLVLNATRNERKKFQLSGMRERKEDKWCAITKAVCQMLQASELKVTGFEMTFKGHTAVADSPVLSGSLISGMLFALNKLFSFNCDPTTLIRLGFNSKRFLKDYEPRMRDLITLFTADPGKIIKYNLDTYDYDYCCYPFVRGSGAITWFIDCSLPEGELEGEVDDFRKLCGKAAELVKGRLRDGARLRELNENDIRRHMHLPITEEMKRALSYVCEESQFADKAHKAILTGNAIAFGKIITAEQRNLFDMAELTSPEVDWLVRRGVEARGVRGVTEVSTGITGTLIALIDEGSETGYFKCFDEYERIFGFKPVVTEYAPAGSMHVVPESEYGYA